MTEHIELSLSYGAVLQQIRLCKQSKLTAIAHRVDYPFIDRIIEQIKKELPFSGFPERKKKYITQQIKQYEQIH